MGLREFELREGAMRIHGKFGRKNRIRGRQRREYLLKYSVSKCLLPENPALGKQKGDRTVGFSALKRSLEYKVLEHGTFNSNALCSDTEVLCPSCRMQR